MTEIPPIPTHLNQDILCIGCGYNLRGLEPSGRCPECGLAIADSNRGDRLVFADPAWLGRLRFGASLKLWNILIFILIAVAGAILMAFVTSAHAIILLVSALGAALGLWATFCITAQEPRISLTEDPVTQRKVIRTCAVIFFVGSIAHGLSDSALAAKVFSSMSGAVVFWMIVGLLTGVTWLVVMVGELKYFRRFALRAPDLKLARSTRIVMWGLAITTGLSSIGTVLINTILAPAMGAMAAARPPAATNTTLAGIGYTATPTTSAGAVGTSTSSAVFPPGGTPVFTPPAGIASMFFGIGSCVFFGSTGIFFMWYVSLLSRYRKLFQTALFHAKSAA